MPPLDIVLASWTLNIPAALVMACAGILYSKGLRAASARGIAWPWWRAVIFYVLGLGGFGVLSFGFTGTYSHDLRWAFTLKVTAYLFIVPLFLAAGQPLTLAKATLSQAGQARLRAFLDHKAIRALSNTVVAALLGLALFTLFLTPWFYPLRTEPLWDATLTILVPLVGMLMAVPIMEDGSTRDVTSLIVVEFIYVFIELVADAVPGVLMRISPEVLDGATQALIGHPAWLPDPLRDQQLAGDLLWFLAEAVDLPLIILMFIRFARSDRREARSFDELTDEELDALNREHLKGPLHGRGTPHA
ncbi:MULTISPECIES: cytochrome c oxidase assembly protein [Paenarthrobacter]|jgi:cytochrome c oxidase assembly factor CtaG|uniref:cytochrome c oxidase assembly protein n=1 Tax=Paenarthrobacter TaxID=1742992 RepID=UPI00222E48AB|nr:cytochrome c oxidase assembly protein [Paenarthrobacter sp. PAE-2]MCW3767227.1 cytochrome c oxidase assembly protein [Paenarthrobacter sp. PAE-2]